ncbi:YfhO family protein [Magnetofaba australis]|nr:YfhO family protein [Magnetofaba australis]
MTEPVETYAAAASAGGESRIRSVLLTAIPLLLLAAIYALFYPQDFFPAHDTQLALANFHYTYSHLLYYGEWPLWMPYGVYGVKLIQMMHPFAILTAWVGAALGVANVLLMFKISLFLGQAVFVMGAMLMTRRLVNDVRVTTLVGVYAASMVVWHWQINFAYFLLYLTPILLYFLLRLADSGQLRWFYLFSLTFLSAVLSWGYLYVMVAVCSLVWGLALLPVGGRRLWARLRRFTLWDALALLGLVGVVVVILKLAQHGIAEMAFMTDDREPGSGRVTLDAFMTFNALKPGTDHIAQMLRGFPVNIDNPAYFGLLPAVALLPGLLISPWSVVKRALFLAVGVIAALFLSGLTAFLAYHLLPPIGVYRHLALLLPMISALLLLLSAYGIKRILDGLTDAQRAKQWLGLGMAPVALLFFLLLWDAATVGTYAKFAHWDQPYPATFEALLLVPFGFRLVLWFGVVLLFITMVARGRFERLARRGFFWLLVAAILDGLSYQASIAYERPRVESGAQESLSLLAAAPPAFAAVRQEALGKDERSQRIWSIVGKKQGPAVQYNDELYFVQTDLCAPILKLVKFPQAVKVLMEALGGQINARAYATHVPLDRPGAKTLLGCGESKFRLVRQGVETASRAQAIALTAAVANPAAVVPLGDPEQAPPSQREVAAQSLPQALLTQAQAASGEATVTGSVHMAAATGGAFTLNIRVEEAEPVWLVAAESYFPGWRATIGGEEAPMRIAYGAFMAVRVPPGAHEVTMTYGAGPVKWMNDLVSVLGAGVALLLLALCAGLLTRREPACAPASDPVDASAAAQAPVASS